MQEKVVIAGIYFNFDEGYCVDGLNREYKLTYLCPLSQVMYWNDRYEEWTRFFVKESKEDKELEEAYKNWVVEKELLT